MPRGHAAVDEKNLREPTAFETVAETWLATIAPATAADVPADQMSQVDS